MAPPIRPDRPTRRPPVDLTPSSGNRPAIRPPADSPTAAPEVGSARPIWTRRAAYAERADGAREVGAADKSSRTTAPDFQGIGAGRDSASVTAPTATTAAPAAAPAANTGIGAARGRTARPSDARAADAPDGPGAGMPREEARRIIDAAMGMSVSSWDSDDHVRNNVTAEVLAHASPAEKAHMLRQLMDGPTGSDDEAAMARILQSVQTPEEMTAVLNGAGGADAVWDELEGSRAAVGQHFRAQGEVGAQILLTIADALPESSWISDDFVANNIDTNVLEHATNEQKAHMLRSLMDGPTGSRDERAMRTVLESIESPDDMMEVLELAGGTETVFDELESERGAFIHHLQDRGDEGHQIIARMATAFPIESSASDDFVRNHVDANTLAQATPEQKGRMLRNLMDGPTGGDDEAAMRRVLGSVTTQAELTQVLDASGGAEAVWDELEGQQAGVVSDLRARGAAGHQMIVTLATSFPETSGAGRAFIRQHVDAAVLNQASVDDKAAMVRRLRSSGSSAADQTDARRILRSAADPIELMTIAERGGGLQAVLGMTAAQQTQVTDAYNANSGDATYRTNLMNLITDPQFTGLAANSKTAVLSQAENYPDARSVENMRRLIQKSWFGDMNLADQQRSVKMIAFVSQHAGDRTVINNTLDRFLADDATSGFDWTTTGTPYGTAGDTNFNFNRRYLPAGNDPVDTTNADTLHMVTHTVAHEVNHVVNGDTVAQTADYFLEEYRGFYVGFIAENGRAPTRDDVVGRAQHLLTSTSGAYNSIRLALADPTEGPRIVAFMQDVLGRTDVTQANAGTLSTVDGTDPAPVPPGDLDN